MSSMCRADSGRAIEAPGAILGWIEVFAATATVTPSFDSPRNIERINYDLILTDCPSGGRLWAKFGLGPDPAPRSSAPFLAARPLHRDAGSQTSDVRGGQSALSVPYG